MNIFYRLKIQAFLSYVFHVYFVICVRACVWCVFWYWSIIIIINLFLWLSVCFKLLLVLLLLIVLCNHVFEFKLTNWPLDCWVSTTTATTTISIIVMCQNSHEQWSERAKFLQSLLLFSTSNYFECCTAFTTLAQFIRHQLYQELVCVCVCKSIGLWISTN
jgi:hypothetical protein